MERQVRISDQKLSGKKQHSRARVNAAVFSPYCDCGDRELVSPAQREAMERL